MTTSRTTQSLFVVGALAACLASYAFGHQTRDALPRGVTRHNGNELENVNEKLAVLLASQAALHRDVASLQARVTEASAPALAASAAPPASVEVAPSAAPVRTAEAMSAQVVVRSVLDDAILRGKWTVADRRLLRAALANADDEGRRELALELTVAVNSGKLSLAEMQGPPI